MRPFAPPEPHRARTPRLGILSLVGALATLAAVPALAQGTTYLLGPGDRVRIQVVEVQELNVELEVAADGTLALPVLGVVPVRGLGEAAVADDLRRRLETAGVRRASVSVRVIAQRSRPVTLVGAVARPGVQTLQAGATLLEVLLAAGGLTADHGPTVTIRRRAENGLSDELEVSVVDLVDRADPAVNVPLLAGDVVSVATAQPITVHFLGEVATPGSTTFKAGERVTLLRAVASIGGLKETASRKLRILREGEDGKRHELVVDFKAILAGRDADVDLENGDLVVVKESFF